MKFIKALIVLAICIIGFGFYRGWFSLSGHGGDATNNKIDVNLTVDPDKVKDDAKIVKDKTTELGNQAKDKVKSMKD